MSPCLYLLLLQNLKTARISFFVAALILSCLALSAVALCFGLDGVYMKILMTCQHAVIKSSLGESMYG